MKLLRMLIAAAVVIAAPLYGQVNHLAQNKTPLFLDNASPQVIALYQNMYNPQPGPEWAQMLINQAEDIFANVEHLDLPAVIVAAMAMQYANEFKPQQVESLYETTKQHLRHYFLLRHYFFSCLLPGRAKIDASIDAIRISQGAPKAFYNALVSINSHELKKDEGLVKIAQQKYGKVKPVTLFHALLYLELKQLTIKDGRIVALLLRNLALAYNQKHMVEHELVVIRVIRELEIEGVLPVISSPESVYSYLMVHNRK
ncbi:MAG: hypothetical protein HWE26_13150 [Alteromonadaceae bacterium]|nr:hypothetical protein [Alteromonadaceae bacterium]